MKTLCRTWVQPPGEKRRRCGGEVCLSLRVGKATYPVCHECAMRYTERLHEWEDAFLAADGIIYTFRECRERAQAVERVARFNLRVVLLDIVRGAEDNPRYRDEEGPA